MAIIATKKMTKMYGMNSNAALIAIFEPLLITDLYSLDAGQ
jgi:hypothetical protein